MERYYSQHELRRVISRYFNHSICNIYHTFIAGYVELLFSMRKLRKLTKKEWKEIGEKYKNGGVYNYRGKLTLFWNGEKLKNDDAGGFLVYDEEERHSWKVIMVLPGVEIIPKGTFYLCENVETVIMADTVKRIDEGVFVDCHNLQFVRLSTNLEYIGDEAFWNCEALTSIFIPESCREIGSDAFCNCEKLIILSVPRHTTLGEDVIYGTALIEASHFETDDLGDYSNTEEINIWVKNMNCNNEEYALHRACSAFNPISDIIYEIVKRQGLASFKKENEIGITPLRYLEENPYANIDQQKLVKRYILEMMGETV